MMRLMPLIIISLALALAALPITAQEVARLRCQKSGCPTNEGGIEEPQLIATNSPSLKLKASAKAFPIVISWFILFLILRLSAQLMGKFLQAIRRITVKIGAGARHYYELILQSRRQRQNKRSREKRRRISLTSTSSLGSLADLLDNANGRGRPRGERYDDDSSSAGYSSANSSFISSGSDSNSIMDDDENSTAMELAALSHSASDSSFETASTNYDEYDSVESRGVGEPATLSKFLEYISESRPSNQVVREENQHQHSLPQRQRINGRGRGNVERKSSLELDHKPRHNKNEAGMYKRSGNESHNRRRRYTIDEKNYPSYQTHFKASEAEKNRDRRKRPNLSKSLTIIGSQT